MEEIIYAELKSNSKFRLVEDYQKRERVPAYDRIGGNMEYKTPVKGYTNLYRTISELPKMANWLLWRLVEVRNSTTNIAVFISKSPLESKNIAIAYKELSSRGFVKRVCKQHYLLNPTAFIPKPGQYEAVLAHWELLTEGAPESEDVV